MNPEARRGGRWPTRRAGPNSPPRPPLRCQIARDTLLSSCTRMRTTLGFSSPGTTQPGLITRPKCSGLGETKVIAIRTVGIGNVHTVDVITSDSPHAGLFMQVGSSPAMGRRAIRDVGKRVHARLRPTSPGASGGCASRTFVQAVLVQPFISEGFGRQLDKRFLDPLPAHCLTSTWNGL